MRAFILGFVIILLTSCHPAITQITDMNNTDWTTAHERDHNTTATYDEAIAYYKRLDQAFAKMKLVEYGKTDIGRPLHALVFSNDSDFDPVSLRKKGRQILLINNGIHPGEPCGVDASMMLLRDYAQKDQLPPNLVLVVIPLYNIGGALNRNSHTRANQDGPESYGFRGNARNLDLNRDFIKADSRNAEAFTRIFQDWQPTLFVDNHTSNGADYQYTMTIIPNQHNRLEKGLGTYLDQDMMPQLYAQMKSRNWESCPYVYARETPDKGIIAFLDLGRYSTGYTSLFNTIGFMPETHMLKPFKDRVASTYAFMESIIYIMKKDGDKIARLKAEANQNIRTQSTFDLNWTLDTEQVNELEFKGYKARYKPSEVSGKDRLYYDRNQPFTKNIPYLKNYKPTLSVEKPYAYIIPQAWREVIERLKWNGVEMTPLQNDQAIKGEVYYIKDFDTQSAYEGHHLHRNVALEKRVETLQFFKGDYVVKVNQSTNRYIVETLEPQAPDSWFAWNFFDGILMQKEHFSSYIFEDEAADILRNQPEIKAALEQRKKEDKEFADNAYAQLEFVYQQSKHYEPTHKRYPVMRAFEF